MWVNLVKNIKQLSVQVECRYDIMVCEKLKFKKSCIIEI